MDSFPNQTTAPQPPGTPPQPPYSPVTPVLSHMNLPPVTDTARGGQPLFAPLAMDLSQTSTSPLFAPEPSPVPISESDNPDAIALRSAISVLQIQKQQALRDIRTLDKLKQAATEHPEEFAQEFLKGNLTTPPTGELHIFSPEPEEPEEQEEKEEQKMKTDDVEKEDDKTPTFGKIPRPQDVVRMPPINWAKYHIVGEPLDKLHEEQRARPSPGEPRRDTLSLPQRSPEHVIAAPYRPFTDRLDSPMRTRSSNKRKHEHG